MAALLFPLSGCGVSSIPDKPAPVLQRRAVTNNSCDKMDQAVRKRSDHRKSAARYPTSSASTSTTRSLKKTSGVGYASNRPYEHQVHLKSPKSTRPLARSQYVVRNVVRKAPSEDKGTHVQDTTPLIRASERKAEVDKPITQEEVDNSIAYLHHLAELSNHNTVNTNEEEAIGIAGVTGSGKSTTVNHLVGCVTTTARDELGEETIIVDPASEQPEVASIGHGAVSHTSMPQIIKDPNNQARVFIDFPGFSDNRGAVVNIANAINIKHVLKQVRSVKLVFLTSYQGLRQDRGESFDDLGRMCEQMFGGVENLRRHQNSVLLGVNRVPAHITTQNVRDRIMRIGSDATAILANRAFLYDPLERGRVDFWSRERFLEEIERMPAIPQRTARNLFQTVLNNDDKALLQRIVEHQVGVMRTALEQEDYPAVDRGWNLFSQLRIIEHDRIEELIERQVRPHIRTYAEARTAALSRHAAAHQFEEAEQILTALQTLNRHFPNENFVDLERLQETLQTARAQHTAQQEAEEARQREAEARQNAEEERERARRERENMEARVREKEIELEGAKRRNRR